MVGGVEEMSELKENMGTDESLDLQNACKVLVYWRVSDLVCLFSLHEVQESFSCEVMLCLSAQLKGNERKKQLGEGLRSAWRVVAFRHARLKQLYNHSLVSCPQNSFMLSWVNLTMYHPLFYRGEHTKYTMVLTEEPRKYTKTILSVLTHNQVNSWLCETWDLLLISPTSQKSISGTTEQLKKKPLTQNK